MSCEWCGAQFERKSEKGPAPKFCSAAHRQRSYEARNHQRAQDQLNSLAKLVGSPGFRAMQQQLAEAMRSAVAPTAAMQEQLAEAMRRATAPTAAMHEQLAEAMRSAVAPTAAMQEQLAEAMRRATAPTAAMQEQLAEAMRSAVAPTAAMQELAETMRSAVAPTAAMQELAETMQRAVAPLAAQATSMGDALTRAAQLYHEINPPNWPEDVSLSQMCELIADTGWSLTYVPRSEVIVELLHVDSADREVVLLAHTEEIVSDCRACLREITDPELVHLVGAVGQALGAFEAGFPIPAQATVASVLGDIINRTFGLTFAAAAKELSEDPGKMPLPYFRFWLVVSTIPRALSRFHCRNGDPVPGRFNRHAAVHTVDPQQYTTLNSLVGLMLVTSLVRQIAEESQ